MKTTMPLEDCQLTKHDYFKVFREYRICEQNLLNQRITWNLTIQGFLFATLGFCVQKLAELKAGEHQSSYPIEQQLKFLVHTITALIRYRAVHGYPVRDGRGRRRSLDIE